MPRPRPPKNNQNSVEARRKTFLDGIGVPKQARFVPDPFQLEAIESLEREQDTLVIAPTGTGKTYIAVQAIAKLIEQQKRTIYTAPLKALSNAKYAEFKQRFEPAASVGLLTGDRKIGGDANVVVATTEIYRNELYRGSENYSLVVLDELHYLGDVQRGPVWEESIILSPNSATLLMLSASISNPDELADWIESVRGRPVHIVRVTERPVELRLGFMHPDFGILPMTSKAGELTHEIERFYKRGDGRGNRGDRRRPRGGGGRGRGRRGRR